GRVVRAPVHEQELDLLVEPLRLEPLDGLEDVGLLVEGRSQDADPHRPAAVARGLRRTRHQPVRRSRSRMAPVIAARAIRPATESAGMATVAIARLSAHSRLTSSLSGWTQESIQSASSCASNQETWSRTSSAPGE